MEFDSSHLVARTRLDTLMVRRELAESKEKAQGLILAGVVRVGGAIVNKPGHRVYVDAVIQVESDGCPYVSRGGLKLEAALKNFDVDPAGKVAIDVGVSTGGFTDCLLQHGAAKIYAVDVGYGQLAWKVRTNPRVVVYERTNFRYFDPTQLVDRPSLGTVDVSFISLKLLLPVLHAVLESKGEALVLVKPQFEVGRNKVEKGGVVRDPQFRQEAVDSVAAAAVTAGFEVMGQFKSPLVGPAGNEEFFLYLAKKQETTNAHG